MAIHVLDVNVLLALFDPWHASYRPTHEWFASNRYSGWATCPLTENGFIRVLSHPTNPSRPGDAAVTSELLSEFCDDARHRFWPADTPISDLVKPGRAFSHAHITDVYLLGLAVRNSGKLATLDRRIPAALIDHGQQALTLIPV